MQSDQYIPAEDIYGEMTQLEQLLDNLEQRGVELEKKLRDNPNGNLLDCRTESARQFKENEDKERFQAQRVHRIH